MTSQFKKLAIELGGNGHKRRGFRNRSQASGIQLRVSRTLHQFSAVECAIFQNAELHRERLLFAGRDKFLLAKPPLPILPDVSQQPETEIISNVKADGSIQDLHLPNLRHEVRIGAAESRRALIRAILRNPLQGSLRKRGGSR